MPMDPTTFEPRRKRGCGGRCGGGVAAEAGLGEAGYPAPSPRITPFQGRGSSLVQLDESSPSPMPRLAYEQPPHLVDGDALNENLDQSPSILLIELPTTISFTVSGATSVRSCPPVPWLALDRSNTLCICPATGETRLCADPSLRGVVIPLPGGRPVDLPTGGPSPSPNPSPGGDPVANGKGSPCIGYSDLRYDVCTIKIPESPLVTWPVSSEDVEKFVGTQCGPEMHHVNPITLRRIGCRGAHEIADSTCASKRCIGVEHTGFHYQIVGVQDASGNIGGLPDAGAIINGLRARVMILGPCSVEGTCA